MSDYNKIIGLSLSLNIKQIARGEVSLDEIKMIRASTCAPNLKTYKAVLRDYMKSYWYDFPKKARNIAMSLWYAGKIDQPRTRGEEANYVGDGAWMDADENTFRIIDGKRVYSGKTRTDF